jgi:glutathione S-transferase
LITLYYAPNTASLCVHWLLLELDLPHRLHKVDLASGEQKTAAYLRLNPAGVVPTLMLEDEPLCESAAMLMHLADREGFRFARPPGTPARASYYQWMIVLANGLQPAFRAYFYPHEPAGEVNQEASQEQARRSIEGGCERIAKHLERTGDYLLGAEPSAPDFLLSMLLLWTRNMKRPSSSWPELRAYSRRMFARPAFEEVLRREGIQHLQGFAQGVV